MTRCGSASALAAALWVEQGLAPSETLDCPPPVLEAATRMLDRRAETERKAADKVEFDESTARMHALLRGDG